MLIFGADRALSLPLRAGLLVTQLVALVAFGGRTSLVLAIVVIAWRATADRGAFAAGDSICGGARLGVRSARVAAARAAAWLAAIWRRSSNASSDDRGSAEARVVIFELFDAFSFEDILLGPDPQRLATLQNTLGIQYGIENSWLGLVFQYGALMTSLLPDRPLRLIGEFWRRGRSLGLGDHAAVPGAGRVLRPAFRSRPSLSTSSRS